MEKNLLLIKTNPKLLCQTASEIPLPKNRFGRRGSTFSSVRLSQRVPSNPIRRNTTRARGRSYKKDKVKTNLEISVILKTGNSLFLLPDAGHGDWGQRQRVECGSQSNGAALLRRLPRTKGGSRGAGHPEHALLTTENRWTLGRHIWLAVGDTNFVIR